MSNHTFLAFLLCHSLFLWFVLATTPELGATDLFPQCREAESRHDKLIGPAKSVSTRMGEAPVRIVDVYLPSGRLAEQKWTDAHSGEVQARLAFEYDASGKKTKKVKYGHDNTLNFTETYFYNTNDYQAGALLRDADGSIETVTVFRCGADDKLNGGFHLNASRNYAVMSSYTYDKEGKRETEFRQEVSEKGLITTKITRTYGKDGLLLEEIESRSQKPLFVKRVYAYDDQGNPVSQSNYERNGRLTDKWVMEYDFDSHGNWTRRIAKRIVKDARRNDESLVTERTVTYYSQEELQGPK